MANSFSYVLAFCSSGRFASICVMGSEIVRFFKLTLCRFCSIIKSFEINAEVAKWQTHETQNLAVVTPCRFESDLRHHTTPRLRMARPVEGLRSMPFEARRA